MNAQNLVLVGFLVFSSRLFVIEGEEEKYDVFCSDKGIPQGYAQYLLIWVQGDA